MSKFQICIGTELVENISLLNKQTNKQKTSFIALLGTSHNFTH